MKSIIKGMGHYVPDNIVTNDDLAKIMDTNDEWITERTGIKERRHVGRDGDEPTSILGYKASLKAIENAGIDKSEIDFIIFATLSPDLYFPGCGVQLQNYLELDTIGALDVRNQCSGFIYALSTAHAYIQAGMYKNILVVGAENHSFGLDMTTRGRGVSVIFGDGAGAMIVSASEDDSSDGILACNMHSEGKYDEELTMAFPGTKYGWVDKLLDENYEVDYQKIYPYMNGTFVFKHAVTRFPETIKESFEKAGKSIEDLDILIPHQANLRISQFLQKKMGLRDDQVFDNIQKYGNTTAASIPLALSEAVEQGKVQRGDLVCLAAFGAGFTWGSVLLRY
ncbi:beta-ketoacyl-ACP synthase III [Flavobacteriaceae bacterium Ap0902]|nr:beta-ketoacyl-ACP synthase III [Flavobacteriaceae bacterium Ap0902]